MKKLTIVSLLGILAATGAQAANSIDGNPMYRPGEGRFVSISDLSSNTDFEVFTLGEEFAYGISNDFSVFAKTAAVLATEPDTDAGIRGLQLGASYRFMNNVNWKADVIAAITQNWLGVDTTDADMEVASYDWSAAAKLGYVAADWTVAAQLEYTYTKDDFDGVNFDSGTWSLGLMGQYVVNSDWNIVGGVGYAIVMDDNVDLHTFDINVGANYNISETMFVGGYVATGWGKVEADGFSSDWEQYDPEFTFGVKFGAEF